MPITHPERGMHSSLLFSAAILQINLQYSGKFEGFLRISIHLLAQQVVQFLPVLQREGPFISSKLGCSGSRPGSYPSQLNQFLKIENFPHRDLWGNLAGLIKIYRMLLSVEPLDAVLTSET